MTKPLVADAAQIREQREILDLVIANNDALKSSYRLAVTDTIDELGGRIPLDVAGRVRAVFGARIREYVGPFLEAHIAASQVEDLVARGLPIPPQAKLDQMARTAAQSVLQNNKINDIFATVQKAVRTEGSPRGMNYSVERLLSDEHITQVVKSLASVARDDFEIRIYNYGRSLSKNNPNGLTGRKRWIVRDPSDSRHSELHGHVFGPDGFGYKGDRIHGPRAHPKNVKEWTSCTCQIEYERNDNSWV